MAPAAGAFTRAGRFVQQPGGYRAFLPNPLPPDPPLADDAELRKLLSDADRALGRLDGVASTLPNPKLFVAMYVRHEAVLSSQIEGTQSTLEDVLVYEAGGEMLDRPKDLPEVVNYVRAMDHGLARIRELPLSLRLIREIHAELLQGVRGQERSPGEFRTSQNWIGPAGCTLDSATFVPPPPHELIRVLGEFERFLHERDTLPHLIHAGLAHAQFETIHPFLDGNGRVGRLLITLLLCEREILQQPLLYLSHFFKAHRAEYYDRLTAIRIGGDWEGWLKFFLRGVFEVSQAATETSRAILALRDVDGKKVDGLGSSANARRLLDYLFEQPVISVDMATEHLGMSFAATNTLIGKFEKADLVREITGQKRNRRYLYQAYYELFERQMVRGLTDVASEVLQKGSLET